MIDSTAQLKVMFLNAENLFLLSDEKLIPEHLKLDQVQWNKLSTSIFEKQAAAKSQGSGENHQGSEPRYLASL